MLNTQQNLGTDDAFVENNDVMGGRGGADRQLSPHWPLSRRTIGWSVILTLVIFSMVILCDFALDSSVWRGELAETKKRTQTCENHEG